MLIVAYARPDWSAATGITSGTRSGKSNCPVDVQVSYNGKVLDSATGQLSASFGTMTVTGEGDDRNVSLNLNDYYDVEIWINGTGTGTMNFTTTSKDLVERLIWPQVWEPKVQPVSLSRWITGFTASIPLWR